MSTNVLRIGMVGYALMGASHAQAWCNARFFDLSLTPELTTVAGRNGDAVSAAAQRHSFASMRVALGEMDLHSMVRLTTIGA